MIDSGIGWLISTPPVTYKSTVSTLLQVAQALFCGSLITVAGLFHFVADLDWPCAIYL